MLRELLFPKSLVKVEETDRYGRFVFGPLERGYGATVGNPLRRVLLSSIPGASIIAVRIDGVLHEFSTVPGVMEDVPEIILNLKKVRFRFDVPEEESALVYLRAEGAREVKASDLEVPDTLTLLTPDVHIATLTKEDARLYMEITVARGRGYVPAEDLPNRDAFPQGTIFVDGVFSPVLRANFTVENVRVGAQTDFEQVVLEVWTDGSVKPEEAVLQAADILVQVFQKAQTIEGIEAQPRKLTFEEKEGLQAILTKPISYLELSKRTESTLKDAGIETVAHLVALTPKEALAIRNFGEKSLEEVETKLAEKGLSLGMDVEEILGPNWQERLIHETQESG